MLEGDEPVRVDLQPVLETLVENAARLCAAEQAFILRFEDGLLNLAVAYNTSMSYEIRGAEPDVPGRYSVTARVALEPDVHIQRSWRDRSTPTLLASATISGSAGGPMLRGDDLLGVITLSRSEARPFTDKQMNSSQPSPTRR